MLPWILLVACGRTVNYQPLEPGRFTIDPRNTPPELQGIELILDLAHDRAELRDNDKVIDLTLTRRPRSAWIGGCGTMTSYVMLEAADLTPRQFELRGRTLSFDQLRAQCAQGGAWLVNRSDRWIFSP